MSLYFFPRSDFRACILNFFFFQAEDGIRDADVTGVQTCALPISDLPRIVALPGEWVQALATQQFSANQKAGDSPAFSALAWVHLGYQADEAGDYEKAVKAYQEAIRLKPVAAVWWSLGITYVHLKQHNQSVKACHEAIRLQPNDAAARNSSSVT